MHHPVGRIALRVETAGEEAHAVRRHLRDRGAAVVPRRQRCGVDAVERDTVIELEIEQPDQAALRERRNQRMGRVPVAQMQRRVRRSGDRLKRDMVLLHPIGLSRAAVQKKAGGSAGFQKCIEPRTQGWLKRSVAPHHDHAVDRPVGVGQIRGLQRRSGDLLGRIDGVAQEIERVGACLECREINPGRRPLVVHGVKGVVGREVIRIERHLHRRRLVRGQSRHRHHDAGGLACGKDDALLRHNLIAQADRHLACVLEGKVAANFDAKRVASGRILPGGPHDRGLTRGRIDCRRQQHFHTRGKRLRKIHTLPAVLLLVGHPD